jgi:hypothetical protein
MAQQYFVKYKNKLSNPLKKNNRSMTVDIPVPSLNKNTTTKFLLQLYTLNP